MLFKSYTVEKNISIINQNLILFYGENIGLKNYFKNTFKKKDNYESLNFNQDDVIDLFYQDSMHFKDGIIAEWNLVEKNIIKNSKIIFDDLQLKGVQQFRDWFQNKYKSLYSYKVINDGHKQFIVNKLD